MKKGKKQKKFVDFDPNTFKVPIVVKTEPFKEKTKKEEEINLVPSTLKPPKKQGFNKQNNYSVHKSKNVTDLNHLAKFRIDDNSPFLSSDEETPEPEKPEFKIVQLKDKSQYDYTSMFNVGTPNQGREKNKDFLEQFIISDYISLIQENFKELTRDEIIQKLLFYNLDIDKLLEDLYNEKEFPFLSEESKKKYLNRNIKKNYEIQEELMKLEKTFPFLEKEIITDSYFSHEMDFIQTKNYIISQNLTNFKKELNDPFSPENAKIEVVNRNKMQNNSYDEDKEEDYKQKLSYLTKENIEAMLNNNYQKNKIEETINVNDYKSIRLQLLSLANLNRKQGNKNEAKRLFDKAREYKDKIDNQIKYNKISSFINNNVRYEESENIIDLHGLSLEEAKILIETKLKKCYNTSSFPLKLITGKGNHSYKNIPVLYPELSKWIRQTLNLVCKGKYEQGYLLIYNKK